MSKRLKKYPPSSKKFKNVTLDDYFVQKDLSRDVFGFLNAVTNPDDVKGYFAVFEIDNSIKATGVYTKDVLETMVIPDILLKHPNAFYKIFPESEFGKIIGKR